MNNEQLRRQSEIDSRRVSTGVVCRVIRESKKAESKTNHRQDKVLEGLLPLLLTHGYLPDNIGAIPEGGGIHTVNGIAFVVPRHMIDFFEQELSKMRIDIEDLSAKEDEVLASDRKHSDSQMQDMRLRKKRIEQNLLHNLADNIFLATVDPKTNGSFPLTGDIFDIFLNTREQQESLAVLVRRDETPTNKEVNKKWTEEVEAYDKEEAEARKKWRKILRNIGDKLKSKAGEQQEEEIAENGR